MKLTNKVMLITYPDSIGKNLTDLNYIMNEYLSESIGGIHLLPFFPSTGDRGFSPTTYEIVDHKFGEWSQIEDLSKNYFLMFDLMINHLSKQSKKFTNFLDSTGKSDMFIDWNKFWPANRPTKKDIDMIYKRKDKEPSLEVRKTDGSLIKVWNTFGDQQIDLNINSNETKAFLKSAMHTFAVHGDTIVRLDAFAYAVKKLNSNDFFVQPEIWNTLNWLSDSAKKEGLMILPEIHEKPKYPMAVSKKGYYIYDFALPMLVLYFIYSGDFVPLVKWLKQSPMHQFTTLDTHDGLGVVDVQGQLTEKQINFTTDHLYQKGSNEKKIYSGPEYKNLDIYQINTTFYSAVGENDNDYLLSRAIQVFAPGIPQIYYVGLFAGKNDLNLLEKTKEGRNINRHYYSEKEIQMEIQRPIVKNILKLLKFRNQSDAFSLDGHIDIQFNNDLLDIRRSNLDKSKSALLRINIKTKKFVITDEVGNVIIK